MPFIDTLLFFLPFIINPSFCVHTENFYPKRDLFTLAPLVMTATFRKSVQDGGELLSLLPLVLLDRRDVVNDEQEGEKGKDDEDDQAVDIDDILDEIAPEIVHIAVKPVPGETVSELLDAVEAQLEDCGTDDEDRDSSSRRKLGGGCQSFKT